MTEHFLPIEPLWRKSPQEQIAILQTRLLVAIVTATVGWVLLLACFAMSVFG